MLKLGCMSLSYKDEFAAGKIDLESFIERAYQMRLDGIDIHTRALASTEPDYLRTIRMQALTAGLPYPTSALAPTLGNRKNSWKTK